MKRSDEQQRGESVAAGQLVLQARSVRVATRAGIPIVEHFDLDLMAGELFGLVGESGSGKTTAALALLGYTRPGLTITHGEVSIAGRSMPAHNERAARSLRGTRISYVPQDPQTSLNPNIRIGHQVADILRVHRPGTDAAQRAASVTEVLRRVGLPVAKEFWRRFPHQLSGGQQQRLALAIALVAEPAVVVLDEPTTGLDVITAHGVMDEVARLRHDQGIAFVLVSHDLTMVASVADRIAVMYAGRVVEEGPAGQVTQQPRHHYTSGLLASVPDPTKPGMVVGIAGVAVGIDDRPTGCRFSPRCLVGTPVCDEAVPPLSDIGGGHSVRCIHPRSALEPVGRRAVHRTEASSANPIFTATDLRIEHPSPAGPFVAVDGVSFHVNRGECLALVGESGSGKTTIARCVAGLTPATAGTLMFDGKPLAALAANRPPAVRRRVQIVFQNPYDSLNPRRSIIANVSRPALLFAPRADRAKARERVVELLDLVRLPRRTHSCFPGDLSGGERQRVAIARALAAEPDLIVCDEITSALDVSVQANVLEVLQDLRGRLGLSLLFITHDLGVVSSIADRTMVLRSGVVLESAQTATILSQPEHEYTRALVSAASWETSA